MTGKHWSEIPESLPQEIKLQLARALDFARDNATQTVREQDGGWAQEADCHPEFDSWWFGGLPDYLETGMGQYQVSQGAYEAAVNLGWV